MTALTLALRRETDWPRLGWFALAAGLLTLGIGVTIVGAYQFGPGLDYSIYMTRASAWLHGEGFYLARQLHGPYPIENGDALYPPTALLLFVPFTFLPAFLWWLIPIGIVVAVIAYWRPSLPALALIGLCMVAGTGFVNTVIKGNPLMWVTAFIALAMVRPAFGPLVMLKPTAFLFAAVGIRSREWWLTLAACFVASLVFLPMWFDWLRTITDGTGHGLDYALSEVPTLCIPLVARWGSRRRPDQVPGVQFLRTQSNAASPS